MKIIKSTLASIIISVLLFSPFLLKAQLIDSGTLDNEMVNDFKTESGFGDSNIIIIIVSGIRIVLGFLALAFLVLTIIAGFKWMTAGGNDEEVKKAQTSLKNSVIGLIIILSAYMITYFIFNMLPFSVGGLMPDPA